MNSIAGVWLNRPGANIASFSPLVMTMLDGNRDIRISPSHSSILGIGYDGTSDMNEKVILEPGIALAGRVHLRDTSVLVPGYYQKIRRSIMENGGEWLAQNVWGSYVAAILDDQGRLQLFRDPTGLSTVYYRIERGMVLFSSDLFSLWNASAEDGEYDVHYLASYAAWGPHTTQHTPIKGYCELRPGECLEAGGDGIRTHSFWNPFECIVRRSENFSLNSEELQDVFLNTVDSAIAGSGPVYVDLSGGIDSATVLSAVSRYREKGELIAATVYHPSVAAASELSQARLVSASLGVDLLEINGEDHLPFTETKKNARFRFKPTPQMLHTSLHEEHARNASEAGSSIFVNGYGGDQVFQSQRHHPLHLADHLIDRSFASFSRELISWCNTLHLPYGPTIGRCLCDLYRSERGNHEDYLGPLRPPEWFSSELVALQSRLQFRPSFWNQLRGVGPFRARQILDIYDAAALVDRCDRHPRSRMHHPFLELPVVEAGLSLPITALAHNAHDRYLFRKVASRLIPESIAWRRTKGEYSGMYQLGLRAGETRIEELLMTGWFVSSNLVRTDILKTQLALAAQGFSPDIWGLLNLITLEIWMKEWKSNTRSSANRLS